MIVDNMFVIIDLISLKPAVDMNKSKDDRLRQITWPQHQRMWL